jgi:ABC-type phosphate transport system substrate-binding protein
MSDPRFTDPRFSDHEMNRDEAVGGIWSWMAGIALIALIAFIVIAGANHKSNTASSNPSPVATGNAPRNMNPPSTTGSGSSSPQPLMPLPNKNVAQ